MPHLLEEGGAQVPLGHTRERKKRCPDYLKEVGGFLEGLWGRRYPTS